MWFIVLGLLALYLLSDGELSLQSIGDSVLDALERGKRLTVSTISDGRDPRVPKGVVLDDPNDLLETACSTLGFRISLAVMSKARVARSEDGDAHWKTKVRICNVVQNQADRLGWTDEQVVLYHTGAGRENRYGRQITGRFASIADPYESDVKIAQRAEQEDMSLGATNFAHPRAFGVQEGTTTFEDFVATMADENKFPGVFPESDTIVFFWRGNVPDGAIAL